MHLDAGQQVWLVTATPYELAATIARKLGLTGALGTIAESVDGVFTGRLVGEILHGAGKAHAVRSLAIREGLNLRRCTAYSDSFNDVPMLSLVGTAVAINPDAALRDLARERGWEIRDFRTARKAARIGVPSALALGARRRRAGRGGVPSSGLATDPIADRLSAAPRDGTRAGSNPTMSIAEDIIGTHYRYPDYFEVDREKVREFARAVKDDHPAHYSEEAAAECGYDTLIASLTFVAVAGRRVQEEIFNQFDVPVNMERVLHRDQKLIFHRPIVAGDKLWFDSYLDSVIESHGAILTEVRGEVTDDDGNPVLTSIVTILGEASHPDETDEVTAQIAAARDAAVARMIAGQTSAGGE